MGADVRGLDGAHVDEARAGGVHEEVQGAERHERVLERGPAVRDAEVEAGPDGELRGVQGEDVLLDEDVGVLVRVQEGQARGGRVSALLELRKELRPRVLLLRHPEEDPAGEREWSLGVPGRGGLDLAFAAEGGVGVILSSSFRGRY